MRRHSLVWLALVVLAVGGQVRGDDYPDANTLLKRLSEKDSQPAVAAANGPAQLKADIKVFQGKVKTLSPEESASEWLALLDRALAPADQSAQMEMAAPYGFGSRPGAGAKEVLLALPPPDHWAALAKAINARPKPTAEGAAVRDFALRVLAGMLTNDAAARRKLFDEAGQTTEMMRQMRWGRTEEAGLILAGADATPEDRVREFEQQLGRTPQSYQPLQAPDLVTLAGREKAEELLRRALTETTWRLEVRRGKATKALAREVALKNVAQLKSQPWNLIDAVDAVALYEALDKKFPLGKSGGKGLLGTLLGVGGGASDDDVYQFERQQAAAHYLAGLIAAGRTDDAVKLAKSLKQEVAHRIEQILSEEIRQPETKRTAYNFFRSLVVDDPSSLYWKTYIKLAAELGKSGEVLADVKAAAARENLTPEVQIRLRSLLVDALLAADQVDEAVAALRAQFKSEGDPDEALGAAVKLAEIGLVLEKPEFANEGVAVASELVKTRPPSSDRPYQRTAHLGSLSRLLSELNRGPEAVELLIQSMQQTMHSNVDDPRVVAVAMARGEVQPQLTSLVTLYGKAGRHAEVLEILDKVPYWGASDLAELIQRAYGGRDAPLGYVVAEALAATGQQDQALKVLDAVLDRQPGYDPAYALLVKITPDRKAAIARLDALFARDQFEERPLIWKADLLRQEGQLDEGEATVRRAIAIDPSDGEQPRGDRMRAYDVLADILEAKGNRQETALYRNVVKAIRMSEDADRLYTAGLIQRAVALYQQALGFFADAYCIQVRLATKLAELGNFEEAAKHYRKAYELMPSSFGRVESHCFGCEGAFSGYLAQQIAEEVFTKLVADDPQKPQVHYLLAYLRNHQDRDLEAAESLKEAVRLDPDYLNAWKMINELDDKTTLPVGMTEQATLNIIRLDPRQRHARAELTGIRDLRGLWNAVESASKREPPRAESLYPLKASKEQMAIQNPEQAALSETVFEEGSADREALRTPAAAVWSTPAMSMLQNMMQITEAGGGAF